MAAKSRDLSELLVDERLFPGRHPAIADAVLKNIEVFVLCHVWCVLHEPRGAWVESIGKDALMVSDIAMAAGALFLIHLHASNQVLVCGLYRVLRIRRAPIHGCIQSGHGRSRCGAIEPPYVDGLIWRGLSPEHVSSKAKDLHIAIKLVGQIANVGRDDGDSRDRAGSSVDLRKRSAAVAEVSASISDLHDRAVETRLRLGDGAAGKQPSTDAKGALKKGTAIRHEKLRSREEAQCGRPGQECFDSDPIKSRQSSASPRPRKNIVG